MDLFRRKSVKDLQQEALTDQSLKRALGQLNLTMLGIGAIIGTGIFVLTGTVAAQNGTYIATTVGRTMPSQTRAIASSSHYGTNGSVAIRFDSLDNDWNMTKHRQSEIAADFIGATKPPIGRVN